MKKQNQHGSLEKSMLTRAGDRIRGLEGSLAGKKSCCFGRLTTLGGGGGGGNQSKRPKTGYAQAVARKTVVRSRVSGGGGESKSLFVYAQRGRTFLFE